MSESYPQISKLAFRTLLPFATTYLGESGVSTLLHIKTKERNRMKVEHDMRLALSNTQPQISRLHRHKHNHHFEYKQLIVNKYIYAKLYILYFF